MTEAVNDPNPDNIEDKDQTSLVIGDKPVAPVVPAAPAVAPVVDEVSAVAYEPTGDVGLDMALAFVGKAGISGEHPAMVAATAGDFSILKATLAAKGVAGWEQFVALGEAAFARTAKEAEAKSTANREAIYKEAGGKEEWVAIQTWAGANATDAEKAEINALLNQGGLAAKGAVKYLADMYGRANNVVVNPREAGAQAGRQQATNSTAPLSPKEYAAAVGALNHKLGGRLEGSKEYANLQARRQAFRG